MIWRLVLELILLKEGLPFELLSKIDDGRALVYANIIRYWRGKEQERQQAMLERVSHGWSW